MTAARSTAGARRSSARHRRKDNWLYGDGYQNWGLIETASDDPLAPPELSIYVIENNWKGPTRLRRHTLRIDGFVALDAP